MFQEQELYASDYTDLNDINLITEYTASITFNSLLENLIQQFVGKNVSNYDAFITSVDHILTHMKQKTEITDDDLLNPTTLEKFLVSFPVYERIDEIVLLFAGSLKTSDLIDMMRLFVVQSLRDNNKAYLKNYFRGILKYYPDVKNTRVAVANAALQFICSLPLSTELFQNYMQTIHEELAVSIESIIDATSVAFSLYNFHVPILQIYANEKKPIDPYGLVFPYVISTDGAMMHFATGKNYRKNYVNSTASKLYEDAKMSPPSPYDVEFVSGTYQRLLEKETQRPGTLYGAMMGAMSAYFMTTIYSGNSMPDIYRVACQKSMMLCEFFIKQTLTVRQGAESDLPLHWHYPRDKQSFINTTVPKLYNIFNSTQIPQEIIKYRNHTEFYNNFVIPESIKKSTNWKTPKGKQQQVNITDDRVKKVFEILRADTGPVSVFRYIQLFFLSFIVLPSPVLLEIMYKLQNYKPMTIISHSVNPKRKRMLHPPDSIENSSFRFIITPLEYKLYEYVLEGRILDVSEYGDYIIKEFTTTAVRGMIDILAQYVQYAHDAAQTHKHAALCLLDKIIASERLNEIITLNMIRRFVARHLWAGFLVYILVLQRKESFFILDKLFKHFQKSIFPAVPEDIELEFPPIVIVNNLFALNVFLNNTFTDDVKETARNYFSNIGNKISISYRNNETSC